MVGASIAGCTTARLLAQRGAEATLVEKRPDIDASFATAAADAGFARWFERFGSRDARAERFCAGARARGRGPGAAAAGAGVRPGEATRVARRRAEGYDPHMWRIVFWVAALGIISMYVFFFVVGGFSFTDSLVLSGVVLTLSAAWIVHSWLEHRRRTASDLRDPRLVHARERRGF